MSQIANSDEDSRLPLLCIGQKDKSIQPACSLIYDVTPALKSSRLRKSGSLFGLVSVSRTGWNPRIAHTSNLNQLSQRPILTSFAVNLSTVSSFEVGSSFSDDISPLTNSMLGRPDETVSCLPQHPHRGFGEAIVCASSIHNLLRIAKKYMRTQNGRAKDGRWLRLRIFMKSHSGMHLTNR